MEKTIDLSQVTDNLYLIILNRIRLVMNGVRTNTFSGDSHWQQVLSSWLVQFPLRRSFDHLDIQVHITSVG
jgi:hypothetical protein